MKQSSYHVLTFFIFALLGLLAQVADCQRDGRRVNSPARRSGAFNSPCGTAEQVSARLGVCLKEIFDMVQGRSIDPKGDADLVQCCDKFAASERCVRTVAKDCLKGLHKTATSAVSAAEHRFRMQACKTASSRGRYMEPLKCARKLGPEVVDMFNNHTAIMQAIRDLKDTAPEYKIMKMCCALDSFDLDIAYRFDRVCPESTPLILNIVHALTDDARSTLCRAPKCKGALDQVIGAKYTPPQNFIEPIAEILYQLNVSD